MIIWLANDNVSPTSILVLELRHVSSLVLSHFGGGVTQLSGLCFRDIAKDQRDRVNFELLDLEDGKLSLKCRDFWSQLTGPNGTNRGDDGKGDESH